MTDTGPILRVTVTHGPVLGGTTLLGGGEKEERLEGALDERVVKCKQSGTNNNNHVGTDKQPTCDTYGRPNEAQCRTTTRMPRGN